MLEEKPGPNMDIEQCELPRASMTELENKKPMEEKPPAITIDSPIEIEKSI